MAQQAEYPLLADPAKKTDFKAWVDDGEARGTIVIDGQHFTVTPDLAFGFIALLMEIQRLNEVIDSKRLEIVGEAS